MALSEAKKRANNNYIKGTYDPVTLRIPKGKKKEIQEYVQLNGESLNSYINRLITEDMEKNTDKQNTQDKE